MLIPGGWQRVSARSAAYINGSNLLAIGLFHVKHRPRYKSGHRGTMRDGATEAGGTDGGDGGGARLRRAPGHLRPSEAASVVAQLRGESSPSAGGSGPRGCVTGNSQGVARPESENHPARSCAPRRG